MCTMEILTPFELAEIRWQLQSIEWAIAHDFGSQSEMYGLVCKMERRIKFSIAERKRIDARAHLTLVVGNKS